MTTSNAYQDLISAKYAGRCRSHLHLSPRCMRHRRISRWRVQPRLIWLAALDGLLQLVINLQDDALGAIFAVLFLFLFFPDTERTHNIIYIISCYAIEDEIGCVEFAAQEETALFIPTEERAIITTIFGKRFEIPDGVGEFEGTRLDPITQRKEIAPGANSNILLRW